MRWGIVSGLLVVVVLLVSCASSVPPAAPPAPPKVARTLEPPNCNECSYGVGCKRVVDVQHVFPPLTADGSMAVLHFTPPEMSCCEPIEAAVTGVAADTADTCREQEKQEQEERARLAPKRTSP